MYLPYGYNVSKINSLNFCISYSGKDDNIDTFIKK